MPSQNYARNSITGAGAGPARGLARCLGSLVWVLAFSLPATAAEVPPACADLPRSLTGMAAAWNDPPAPPDSGGRVPVGRKFVVQLRPVPELGELAGRAAQRNREGRGIALDVEISVPGEYRVALSQRAWIEVAEKGGRGRILGAATSDKRLACAGIAKNLGFEVLQAGPHRLQITEVPAEEVEVLVWPASGVPAAGQR